jgi:hypothetical protein
MAAHWATCGMQCRKPAPCHCSALFDRIGGAARTLYSPRITLVTTNDKVYAIRFDQRRGSRIASIDPDAADRARRTKPSIPLIGVHGIGTRDEVTTVKNLDGVDSAEPGGVARITTGQHAPVAVWHISRTLSERLGSTNIASLFLKRLLKYPFSRKHIYNQTSSQSSHNQPGRSKAARCRPHSPVSVLAPRFDL